MDIRNSEESEFDKNERKKKSEPGTETGLKANSDDMFSIYVFGAYVENISSEIGICTVFLTTCGKHTK